MLFYTILFAPSALFTPHFSTAVLGNTWVCQPLDLYDPHCFSIVSIASQPACKTTFCSLQRNPW